MQRENNSLSLRLSLAMNNATDVSGVYNGISGMISSDCQCLRPTELLAGCMRGYSLSYYSEWNPSILAMTEVSANPITKTIKNIKQKQKQIDL